MAYKVTAPLVIIRNAETGADWYGYDKAIVPTGLNDERCKQLATEGLLEKVKDSSSKKDDADTKSSNGKPTSVKDILADVGTDKAKAQEYLDAENAAATPRSSLVEGLQAVLAAEA